MAEGERPQERSNVDGAEARAKTRPITPCRGSVMSSIESAPQTIHRQRCDLNPSVRALVDTLSCCRDGSSTTK